jgi:hypothetical protein
MRMACHGLTLLAKLRAQLVIVWADTLDVLSDGYGIIRVEWADGAMIDSLRWGMDLKFHTSLNTGGGFFKIGTERLEATPMARFAAKGFYCQSEEDLRLTMNPDTMRFHAGSLEVVGNTRHDSTLTEVVRVQAQRDVNLSGRDDVVMFANDDVKLNALDDVILDSVDDIRLAALDDVRLNAMNELELVEVHRSNLGTDESDVPGSNSTCVMGKLKLNFGVPLGSPLTGTPADTMYLAEKVQIGGQVNSVFGPTTFDGPVSGRDPTLAALFVTSAYYELVMMQFTAQMQALSSRFCNCNPRLNKTLQQMTKHAILLLIATCLGVKSGGVDWRTKRYQYWLNDELLDPLADPTDPNRSCLLTRAMCFLHDLGLTRRCGSDTTCLLPSI